MGYDVVISDNPEVGTIHAPKIMGATAYEVIDNVVYCYQVHNRPGSLNRKDLMAIQAKYRLPLKVKKCLRIRRVNAVRRS